ncbi:phosphotransferase [Georgenia wangjunii]|uniref:phosphotransferase n=1 Tax=Georgenia wangjunii TaxID=3117730 RepID=UPI002F26CD0A
MRAVAAGPVPALVDALAAEGLALARAHPRDDAHLLLAVTSGTGEEIAGQWFAYPDRAAHVAAATRAALGPGTPAAARVRQVGERIVLQPGGADRRLPTLARLVAEPGASLVAHRPERRGVLRRAGAAGPVTFTKVVRPGRAAGAAATLAAVGRSTGLRVPRVLAAGPTTLVMSALPGRTLHDTLADPDPDPGPDPVTGADAFRRVGTNVGAALRRFHAVPPAVVQHGGPQAGLHDAAAELAVTRRWIAHAERFGVLPLPAAEVAATLDRAASALLTSSRPVLLHRDLHDKQLLLDRDGEVGILDLDLSAPGDPALDLANLLVHVELRARQHHVTPQGARACAEGILTGYGPSAAVRRSLPGYAHATRLRLLAVYAFRPTSTDAACRLLTDPWEFS